jgi:ABC-2 type transport system ATP-binding protein
LPPDAAEGRQDAAPLIEVDGLTQDYPGHRALDDVRFAIPGRSVTALVGPNGAGKTTLLRCLAALDPPFAGRIRIAGLDAGERPRAVHRLTGFLQDFFGLYDPLTVAETLWHAVAARGVPRADRAARVAWAAQAVGLSDRMDQRAGTLSRGLRQRLAIARTVAHRPRVVLLDEPASGLDPESRAELAGLLRSLRDDLGMTLIVSSHILAELQDYSTHVMILRHGRLVRYESLGDAAAGGAAADLGAARLALTLAHPCPEAVATLTARAGVTLIDGGPDDTRLVLMLDGGADPDARVDLLRDMLSEGWPVCGFDIDRRNLQDVYLDHLRTGAGGPT